MNWTRIRQLVMEINKELKCGNTPKKVVKKKPTTNYKKDQTNKKIPSKVPAQVEPPTDNKEEIKQPVIKDYGEGCVDEKGAKDGYAYIFRFPHAVCTEYNSGEQGGTQKGCAGTVLKENYSVASHNMPCGTKLYIPSLKGIINSTGVFVVEDTGGHCFDFDIFVSKDKIGKVGKANHEVFILEWGTKKMTTSYTYIIKYYIEKNKLSLYHNAWVSYNKMGASVINFWRFNEEDKEIEKQDWYKNI